MPSISLLLKSLAVKIVLLASAWLGIGDPTLSAFNPAGGLTYRLQTSAGTTDTTIRLSSLKNRSDIPLTMAILNTDIGYGTLSPQTDRSELISFTGITQNSNGTASLTGVSRGLADIYPFTASTTLRNSHPGQSIFILSDSPQLFEEYAKIRSTVSITGAWGFTTAATSSDECSSSVEYCTKAYIDNISITGSATTTEYATGGNVRLTESSLVGTGTASSTSGAPLILANRNASSTYDGRQKNLVVVTGSSNTIDSNYIATSSTNTYNFAGAISFTNATTSISGKLAIASSSPSLNVNLSVNGGAIISATTTVGGLVATTSINATQFSATATSTFNGGIKLANGCFDDGIACVKTKYSTFSTSTGVLSTNQTKTIFVGFTPKYFQGMVWTDATSDTSIQSIFSQNGSTVMAMQGGTGLAIDTFTSSDILTRNTANDDLTVSINNITSTGFDLVYSGIAGSFLDVKINIMIIGE